MCDCSATKLTSSALYSLQSEHVEEVNRLCEALTTAIPTCTLRDLLNCCCKVRNTCGLSLRAQYAHSHTPLFAPFVLHRRCAVTATSSEFQLAAVL